MQQRPLPAEPSLQPGKSGSFVKVISAYTGDALGQRQNCHCRACDSAKTVSCGQLPVVLFQEGRPKRRPLCTTQSAAGAGRTHTHKHINPPGCPQISIYGGGWYQLLEEPHAALRTHLRILTGIKGGVQSWGEASQVAGHWPLACVRPEIHSQHLKKKVRGETH